MLDIRHPRRTLAISLLLIAGGCHAEQKASPKPPAKAEAVAHEADLLKVTLTPEAQRRLGIRTVRVGGGGAAGIRQTSGEIVVPSIGSTGVPTGSTSNLAQLGTQQTVADGEVARTEALAKLAVIALNRTQALVREEAGSIRARDEAAAALATARAAAAAAREQRRLLGPPIAAMARQSTLWVRVPVFGTDVPAIDRGRAAMIAPLGGSEGKRPGRPVQAPPSSNAVAGTVDLYFAVNNRDRAYRVGQRVAVELPLGRPTEGLAVPNAAIVRDIYGGEWVYRRTAADAFVRQRIEVAAVSGGTALLSRGLEPGADIVTDGAAELFGTEFGTPH